MKLCVLAAALTLFGTAAAVPITGRHAKKPFFNNIRGGGDYSQFKSSGEYSIENPMSTAAAEVSNTQKTESAPAAPSLKAVGIVAAAAFVITALLKTTTVAGVSAGEIVSGDTAWMMTATALVLLMTPGLGLFEAGLLRAKNSVSTIMQCFSGLAVLSLLWFVVGFSFVFGPKSWGLVASPTSHFMFKGVGWDTSLPMAPTIPGVLFASFQCMFAAITPLLVTGAFAERLKFTGFLSFILLWSLGCYYPMAHLVWGGGWLAKRGVIDFAGGIVIHAIAGVASLVTAKMLGPRAGFERREDEGASLEPHSLMMALLGAGLLWMGWFGFNAGSSLTAGALSASTLLVTHMAASAGTVTWVLLDWISTGKPTFVGAINGALAGLAGVTPASGFVHAQSGVAIGLLCGLASYYGVFFLKERLRVDDALDVSSVHGITGIVGSLAVGLYASKAINSAGADGLFFGGGLAQLGKQLLGVVVACGWSLAVTFGIMKLLAANDMARVSTVVEIAGLDADEHGETSYVLA